MTEVVNIHCIGISNFRVILNKIKNATEIVGTRTRCQQASLLNFVFRIFFSAPIHRINPTPERKVPTSVSVSCLNGGTCISNATRTAPKT